MKKLLYTQDNIFWLPKGMKATVETYLSDEFPNIDLCPSVYAFVFKEKNILQTDLREGERLTRTLDIPGGHIEGKETPEQSVIRETFEETGVIIKSPKLVAYKKIIIHSPEPNDWKYSYPISYMLYFLAKVKKETKFDGNKDTHGRVWLKPQEYKKSQWCVIDKILIDEILKNKDIK